MNCRQIFWLAALLAAQAAILSLLHTGHAQANPVYRCRDTYQQQPCQHTDVQSMLVLKDQPTPAQVAQARLIGAQDIKAYQRLIRHRQHEIRNAPRARAVALSSVRFGDGPFGSTASASGGSVGKAHRLHRRKDVRIAKVPQPRPELQASAQRP